MITILLLGTLEVYVNDQPVTRFATAKTTALLAYLALERDQMHTRSHLISLFWPDNDEPSARQNLSQTLTRLRRTLGPAADAIVATRTAVGVRLTAPLRVDAGEFLRLLDTSAQHAHKDKSSCPECQAMLAEAVALMRGEFLSDVQLSHSVDFEQWLLLQREAIHERYLLALSDLAEGALERADYRAAIDYARRQIALEAWRERAYRQLMLALALDGQPAAALNEYARLRSTLETELGVEPTTGSRELAEQIRSGSLATPAGTPTPDARTTNLPGSLTSFVGRDRELALIGELLANQHARLITITGPGGIGKTRLAIEVAQQHIAAQPVQTPEPIWFVSLIGVEKADDVPIAIANTLNLPLLAQQPVAQSVVAQLQNRKMLLILDNFEQVLQARAWVLTLLQAARDLRVIVTSRERLRLQAEEWLALGGLSLPPAVAGPEAARDYAATKLFIDRARRLDHSFRLDQASWPHIMHICRQLGGLPLGIELAAGLLETHPINVIAGLITEDASVLVTDYLDVSEHQRSIVRVFAESWKLLPQPERALLARLSIFETEFSRQAALQVGAGNPGQLASLVRKSLVLPTAAGQFALHPLIRQFAAAQLPPDQNALRIAHAEYYAALLAGAVPDVFDKAKHLKLPRLLPLLPDLRACWAWSVRTGDLRLLEALLDPLYQLLRETAQLQEGQQLLQNGWQQLNAAWPAAQRTRAQRVFLAHLATRLGFFLSFRADMVAARSLLTLALQDFEALNMSAEQDLPLRTLTDIANKLGEHEENLRYCQMALALAEADGNVLKICRALGNLAVALYHLNRLPEARDFSLRSLAKGEGHEPDYERAITISNLGQIELADGNLAAARSLLEESLRIREQYSNTYRIGSAHRYLGMLALAEGDAASAEQHFETALRCYTAADRRDSLGYVYLGLARVALARNELETACQHLRETLRQALEAHMDSVGLEALSVWGEWLWWNGDQQQAEAILQFVHHHPASDGILRRDVAAFLQMHGLPAGQATAQGDWQAMAHAALTASENSCAKTPAAAHSRLAATSLP